MPHKHAIDLDTETGLPRKAVSKWAVWSMGALQAIAIAAILHMLRVQEKQAADIADLRVNVAKIHGLLKISSVVSARDVATNPGHSVQNSPN